jgi:hypothetical protein
MSCVLAYQNIDFKARAATIACELFSAIIPLCTWRENLNNNKWGLDFEGPEVFICVPVGSITRDNYIRHYRWLTGYAYILVIESVARSASAKLFP